MKLAYSLLAFLTVSSGASFAADGGKTLTVYSERKEQLIKPILDEYTKETGVKVNFLSDSVATLTQRLKAEGD
ncbi:MAG: iron ABC transporter substrate-binding protein, partial [Pedobacter sp.]